MERINQESLLDWYNTRGGRVIIKPTFGDKLTSRDVIGSPLKKNKKVKTKKVETFVQSLERKGFKVGYVQLSGGRVRKTKLMSLEDVKARFTGVESVYFRDLEGKNYSKVYKL